MQLSPFSLKKINPVRNLFHVPKVQSAVVDDELFIGTST